MRDRILTTHVGSLPRPKDLLDLMKAKIMGVGHQPDAREAYAARVQSAVDECVRRQAECGIDIINDGEQSKPGFFTYVRERLEGFEPRPQQRNKGWALEVAAFPEYYEQYFKEAMAGGAIAPVVPLVCTGPIRYRGEEALQRDIDNLKRAASRVEHQAVFMPSIAPSGVGSNEYYRTEEEFFHAGAAALRTEYTAIVNAGFVLQIDDPFFTYISDRNLGQVRSSAGRRPPRRKKAVAAEFLTRFPPRSMLPPL
jgi:5-methyltetrahydropteroyltriglutamate--homocysteine methyltransferase